MVNREHRPYPKHKRITLLTVELRWFAFTLNMVTRRNHTIAVVRPNKRLASFRYRTP